MPAAYPKCVTDVSMTYERRKRLRYEMDCLVTVLTPGRGKKRVIGLGRLHDISENGARFFLDHSLGVGTRISLEVDFQHPDGEITAIRYRAVVKRVFQGESFEIAVSLLKGESFIRGKSSREKRGQLPWDWLSKGSRWIN